MNLNDIEELGIYSDFTYKQLEDLTTDKLNNISILKQELKDINFKNYETKNIIIFLKN